AATSGKNGGARIAAASRPASRRALRSPSLRNFSPNVSAAANPNEWGILPPASIAQDSSRVGAVPALYPIPGRRNGMTSAAWRGVTLLAVALLLPACNFTFTTADDPSLSTAPQDPFALQIPLNDANGVQPHNTQFAWGALAGAVSYDLE